MPGINMYLCLTECYIFVLPQYIQKPIIDLDIKSQGQNMNKAYLSVVTTITINGTFMSLVKGRI